MLHFLIGFTPNTAVKSIRRRGLLGVKKLENGTLVRRENSRRVVIGKEDES